MPSLRELQTRILDALLTASFEPAAPLIAAPVDGALARLGVYANNMRSNFVDSLRGSFPAIVRLVGEEYFAQTARAFQRRHPSRSGDLQHAGRDFPAYLAELHSADEFDYLAHVARLEWLIQESLLAAEHAPLDLQKLAGVDSSAYDALHFELHPTLRLFESPYPARRIRDANVGSDPPEAIDLSSASDRLALMRKQMQLQFLPLTVGESAFLQALLGGEPFASAVAAGDESDPDFDATAALGRFVAAEAIVDC
ncbi:MAG: hypothetical protein QOD56_967 [Gammaproteobacteria bacterium]|jgi:hypothetical protein|nr:hypothetical protein [Gammaproteobacteria bacterium]